MSTNDKKEQKTYFKTCIDCGKFVPKNRWVPVDHPWKKGAMCRDCLSGYDGPEYH